MEEKSHQNFYLIFFLVVALSFSTRFYKVLEPDHVCWDETHFGKMGSWYINRTFFFDVHPPLGKMLIALSGYLTGYDGSFPFEKPGDKYENTNYHGMRIFCAFLGACIGPMAFLIVWELTFSCTASFLASMLIVLDVGVLTLTQYILLDPILLFFIVNSTYGIVKFNNCFNEPFRLKWWFWLCFTGFMLACAMSVKFVGLFIVIYCGLHTISSLWTVLADLSHPVGHTVKHFIARVLGLIILPAFCYVLFFYIHLKVLSKSGNGDGFFSSSFQSQLQGNSLYNASMPREVAYGAVVTLKNRRTGGGYLHSHWHLYPEGVGARQQQVTTYTHKDENNRWLIKPYDDDVEIDGIEFLRHGDLIRLEHVPTKRNLHSHKEPAPITKKHLQVTCYGENGTGDPNDIFKVQIVNGQEGDIVTTVTSQIKLVHYLQHCVLTTSGKQLPTWAYEQQEVSCSPNLRDSYAVWNVEHNISPNGLLPNVSFEVYASSFFERFLESHAVMLQGNSGLKPKEGETTSRPWQWPINLRGQFFSGSNYRVYLLGNPVIWWANLAFLVVFMTVYFVSAIIQKRKLEFSYFKTDDHRRYMNACQWLFVGYVLHYIPFYAMGRVLYYHHYFPALLFSSMLSGVIFTYFLNVITYFMNDKLGSSIFHWLVGGVLSSIIYSFYLFSPLAYGMSGPYAQDPNSTMHGLKWVETWEF